MDRHTLIDRLEWLDNDEPPEEHMWRRRGHLKSMVLVKGPVDRYSDLELELLVEFSDRQTAGYDAMYDTKSESSKIKARDNANAIVVGKAYDDRWLRKRISWIMGVIFSPNLPEAMAVFDRGLGKDWVLGKSALIDFVTGGEVVVHNIAAYDGELRDAPHYHRYIAAAEDGTKITFSEAAIRVIAETPQKLESLLGLR